MRGWMVLLAGLLVWAAHFFVLYTIASLFPGMTLARTLALLATIPAIAADIAILWISLVRRPGHRDDLDRWILDLGAVGAALSLIAVLWQAIPAIMT